MVKFLVHGNYVGDGVAGLLKEGGSSRIAVAKKLIESVGGTLECFYYAFGEYDFYAIAEVPDHSTIVALSLTLNATGVIKTGTTILLTAEEMDAATKITPTYRPPGQ